ncbi:MAG: 50S ribosomal protein L10 [Flavobacteriia bacterium]|nr:50S ribosomal protein L10 [Flavobacteriia bacterium]
MTREEKNQEIEALVGILEGVSTLYIADIAGLDAETTSNLRRQAFKNDIKISVVKNTLLKKAMERTDKPFEGLYETLKGNTSIMLSDTGNAPAKLIKEFRKKSDKPLLKGAYIEEAIYVGDEQLDALSNIKSKDELIGDVIMLLQSPAKNVISGLQASAGNKVAGLVKALEERAQ